MSTINTSSLSDHLPPALTADYLHSMKTSEPKAQQIIPSFLYFQNASVSVLTLCSLLPEILSESKVDSCSPDVLSISNSLVFIDNDLCVSAAFPTCSIRVPRVMLSIQTGYTPTASKVDNGK
ncbi:putative LRR receptor-like serine/threonine-protein kinase [Dorcoceras hygrometricum]|uniref:Putative LRR receptor-like serine/threonine-protein kinase n=1 Tax=Dorcoceras hygrometricum TaxID=472368 RepID=A0A2Z7D122_9LAMI|nr:putative LRR receptor-like serine/threonine-protein kinase [Dorcoceras hygrometricum]